MEIQCEVHFVNCRSRRLRFLPRRDASICRLRNRVSYTGLLYFICFSLDFMSYDIPDLSFSTNSFSFWSRSMKTRTDHSPALRIYRSQCSMLDSSPVMHTEQYKTAPSRSDQAYFAERFTMHDLATTGKASCPQVHHTRQFDRLIASNF